MTKKNGGYVIVRDVVAAGELAGRPGVFMPAVVHYLRHAHRDQSDLCWTPHAKCAWRYHSLEDAAAVVLVMERLDRPPPRIIPWSRRGKRATQKWVPK